MKFVFSMLNNLLIKNVFAMMGKRQALTYKEGIYMEIYKTHIAGIVSHVGNVNTYLLNVPDGVHWEEGAHMHVALPGFNIGEKPDKQLVRHMSIMTLPEEEKLGFTTRIDSSNSIFKQRLSAMQVGEDVFVFKLGSVMTLRRNGCPAVLISMGVAMATMRPLLLRYGQNQQGIPWIESINVSRLPEALYETDVEKYKSSSCCHTQLVGRDMLKQNIYKIVERLDGKKANFYVAGSDVFLRDVVTELLRKGIDEEQIVLDKKPEKRQAFFEEYICW